MKGKNKKVLIITFVVIILIIPIVMILKNIKDDNDLLSKIMNEITTSSSVLEDNIKIYNQNRDKLVSSLNGYYSDMLANDYDKYINILKDQENIIKAIYSNVEALADNCGDRLFSKKEVNNICNNFEDYYETVVNVYIDDETKVNELIKSYNKNTNKNLVEYHSDKITDYIDYNKDGEYLGRE